MVGGRLRRRKACPSVPFVLWNSTASLLPPAWEARGDDLPISKNLGKEWAGLAEWTDWSQLGAGRQETDAATV